MNPAQTHLVLNHFPIVACFLGTFVLLWGMVRDREEVRQVALVIFVMAALVTIPVFLTGEPAEGIVEKIPGVFAAGIHDHEEAGEATMIAVQILGALALIALLLEKFKGKTPRWTLAIVLLIALTATGMLGWTANLGGKIRHTETNGPISTVP